MSSYAVFISSCWLCCRYSSVTMLASPPSAFASLPFGGGRVTIFISPKYLSNLR